MSVYTTEADANTLRGALHSLTITLESLAREAALHGDSEKVNYITERVQLGRAALKSTRAFMDHLDSAA